VARRRQPVRTRARCLRAGRLLVLGVAVLVAFLYYRPLTSYLETRSDVNRRHAEVVALRAERTGLEQRLAKSTSASALRREARRIGYVRPGEQLFIVKGIPEWRRARASSQRATLRRDG
jgi:cell division protein FtsB